MPMNNEPNAHIGHGALAVKAFGVTDRGRVRPSNEDQFLSAELTKAMRIWQTSLPEPKAQFGMERGHLFLVADGMGGHRAGEQASALAVVAIEQFTLNTFKWFFDSNGPEAQRVLTQFQRALHQADGILEEATEHARVRIQGQSGRLDRRRRSTASCHERQRIYPHQGNGRSNVSVARQESLSSAQGALAAATAAPWRCGGRRAPRREAPGRRS
jgi:hypothetical protein